MSRASLELRFLRISLKFPSLPRLKIILRFEIEVKNLNLKLSSPSQLDFLCDGKRITNLKTFKSGLEQRWLRDRIFSGSKIPHPGEFFQISPEKNTQKSRTFISWRITNLDYQTSGNITSVDLYQKNVRNPRKIPKPEKSNKKYAICNTCSSSKIDQIH